MKVTGFYRCDCGAVTVILENEQQFSCFEGNLDKFFPNTDFCSPLIKEYNQTFSCNHCVNGWGLDLCSCGSKENVGDCECGSNTSSQVLPY